MANNEKLDLRNLQCDNEVLETENKQLLSSARVSLKQEAHPCRGRHLKQLVEGVFSELFNGRGLDINRLRPQIQSLY